MGSTSKFEELIIAYLSNELNREDEAFVLQWINSSEENKKYFQELEKTMRLLSDNHDIESIDVEDEWQKLSRSIHETEKNDFKEESLITEKVPVIPLQRSNRRLITGVVSLIIAACVMVFWGIQTEWSFGSKSADKALADNAREQVKSTEYNVHYVKNSDPRDKEFQLEDGTAVVLAENSEMWYMVPFSENKRDITLRGKANFKVAKDSARPFTVISAEIATTALGTEFSVDAFENASNIVVRLFEGKVVVKSAAGVLKKLERDIYLQPGEELVYNKQRGSDIVRKFNKRGKNAGKESQFVQAKGTDAPLIPKAEKGNWYMFNNQTLPEVFAQLELMYQVKIVYSKKEVGRIYFVGKFRKEESLEVILGRITSINNLKLSKEDNKYFITK